MGTSEFFGHLRPWSRRKHRLLGKYILPFSAKVATVSASREIFIVDGFAGAARYEDGSDGSPVLIAKFSDECRQWRRPALLRLINVEPDTQKSGIFLSLEEATEQWVQSGAVVNLNLAFRDALPEIIRMIGKNPALFFIDPFGPTYLHFDDLLPILNRTQSATELIINFDQDGLRRIMNTTRSEKMHPKAAWTNEQNVSKVLGSDKWKALTGNKLSSVEEEQFLLREYMSNLTKFGYEVVAYPIRESLTAKPKYYFVYCTRHADGIELMYDFIREEEDLLYGDHVTDRLPLFGDEASLGNAVESRCRELRGEIEAMIATQKSFSRGELRRALLRSRFGDFHSKDCNSVVKDLITEGIIAEVNGKTRINDSDRLKRV